MVTRKSQVAPTEESTRSELFKVLARLKTSREVEEFLLDLCTPGELRAMSERWRAAQMVAEEVPYRRICELTGLSTATVTRVARSLNEGSGYQKQIARKP